jgi:hypothetical protein
LAQQGYPYCEALLDNQAKALAQKAIQMALEGDPVALRLCLDRICPPRKDRPVSFPLPRITSAPDAADATAVSNGAITPNEAAEISKVIDGFVKAHQVTELDDRVTPERLLTDEQLHGIASGGAPPKLLLVNPR